MENTILLYRLDIQIVFVNGRELIFSLKKKKIEKIEERKRFVCP